MDRQRRAPALSARGSRVVLSSGERRLRRDVASGCKNSKEQARQKAELTAALDAFKAQVAELQKQAAPLRARFDALPEDLPGLETVRSDLFAVEEVLGVEDGRGKWLSGELEKAFASGKKQEIEAVRNAIPKGNDGIPKLMLKVTHELVPFERLVAQSRVFEELEAAKEREARRRGGRGVRSNGGRHALASESGSPSHRGRVCGPIAKREASHTRGM